MNGKYVTLSGTMNELKDEGYTQDFNLKDQCIVCAQFGKPLSPEDFVIDKVFRFEGATNPDDQAILYAISSERLGLKGVLVNGYGISAVPEIDAIISKLKIKH